MPPPMKEAGGPDAAGAQAGEDEPVLEEIAPAPLDARARNKKLAILVGAGGLLVFVAGLYVALRPSGSDAPGGDATAATQGTEA
ncbi:MAG: hypothetical protein ABSE73_31035, partial [Planctomycetota bacterium]